MRAQKAPGPNHRRDDGTGTDADQLGQQIGPVATSEIPASQVSVYDGSEFVGTVTERTDGGGFDAVNANGDLVGFFRTRLEASRALPIGRAP